MLSKQIQKQPNKKDINKMLKIPCASLATYLWCDIWNMLELWFFFHFLSSSIVLAYKLCIYFFWTLFSGLNHALNVASFVIYSKVFALNQKKARWFFSSRIMKTKCIQRRKIQMNCANNAFISLGTEKRNHCAKFWARVRLLWNKWRKKGNSTHCTDLMTKKMNEST